MTLEEAISARVSADASLRPLLAEDDGWSMRLTGVPGVTFTMVVDLRPQHMKGFQRVRQSTVQVDAWGDTRGQAGAIRAALIAILVPSDTVDDVRFQRAMIAAVRGGGAPEQSGERQRYRGELCRESIDFIFTHNAN